MKIDAALVWIRKEFKNWDEAKTIVDACKTLGLGVRLYVMGSCKVEGWEKVRKGKPAGEVGFFLKEEVELMVSTRGKEKAHYIGLMHSGRPEVTLVDHESTPGRFYAELEIGTED